MELLQHPEDVIKTVLIQLQQSVVHPAFVIKRLLHSSVINVLHSVMQQQMLVLQEMLVVL